MEQHIGACMKLYQDKNYSDCFKILLGLIIKYPFNGTIYLLASNCAYLNSNINLSMKICEYALSQPMKEKQIKVGLLENLIKIYFNQKQYVAAACWAVELKKIAMTNALACIADVQFKLQNYFVDHKLVQNIQNVIEANQGQQITSVLQFLKCNLCILLNIDVEQQFNNIKQIYLNNPNLQFSILQNYQIYNQLNNNDYGIYKLDKILHSKFVIIQYHSKIEECNKIYKEYQLEQNDIAKKALKVQLEDQEINATNLENSMTKKIEQMIQETGDKLLLLFSTFHPNKGRQLFTYENLLAAFDFISITYFQLFGVTNVQYKFITFLHIINNLRKQDFKAALIWQQIDKIFNNLLIIAHDNSRIKNTTANTLIVSDLLIACLYAQNLKYQEEELLFEKAIEFIELIQSKNLDQIKQYQLFSVLFSLRENNLETLLLASQFLRFAELGLNLYLSTLTVQLGQRQHLMMNAIQLVNEQYGKNVNKEYVLALLLKGKPLSEFLNKVTGRQLLILGQLIQIQNFNLFNEILQKNITDSKFTNDQNYQLFKMYTISNNIQFIHTQYTKFKLAQKYQFDANYPLKTSESKLIIKCEANFREQLLRNIKKAHQIALSLLNNDKSINTEVGINLLMCLTSATLANQFQEQNHYNFCQDLFNTIQQNTQIEQTVLQQILQQLIQVSTQFKDDISVLKYFAQYLSSVSGQSDQSIEQLLTNIDISKIAESKQFVVILVCVLQTLIVSTQAKKLVDQIAFQQQIWIIEQLFVLILNQKFNSQYGSLNYSLFQVRNYLIALINNKEYCGEISKQIIDFDPENHNQHIENKHSELCYESQVVKKYFGQAIKTSDYENDTTICLMEELLQLQLKSSEQRVQMQASSDEQV